MHEKTYINELIKLLRNLIKDQRKQIVAAGDVVARSLMNDGVIHVFGTGHSSLVAQEAFMRAGGLLPVNALLDERVLLSGGSLNSSAMERQYGLAADILAAHDVRTSDAGIVVSNAGRNAAPVEMAFEMKKRGMAVIAITSVTHSSSVEPSHASGKKLLNLADVVLDNGAPYGDALITIPGLGVKMGAVSTVTGAALINSVFISAAEIMLAEGVEPVALPSGNIAGADFSQVQAAMEKYHGRIKYL